MQGPGEPRADCGGEDKQYKNDPNDELTHPAFGASRHQGLDLLLALNGHRWPAAGCLLSGVKQTSQSNSANWPSAIAPLSEQRRT
jgi:hypothetical protein